MFSKEDFQEFHKDAFKVSASLQQSLELMQIALEHYIQSSDFGRKSPELIRSSIEQTYVNFFTKTSTPDEYQEISDFEITHLLERQKQFYLKNKKVDIEVEKIKSSLQKQKSRLNTRIFFVLFVIVMITLINRRMNAPIIVSESIKELSSLYVEKTPYDYSVDDFKTVSKLKLKVSPIDLKPKDLTLKGIKNTNYLGQSALAIIYENKNLQKVLVIQFENKNKEIEKKLELSKKIQYKDLEISFIRKNDLIIGLAAPLF